MQTPVVAILLAAAGVCEAAEILIERRYLHLPVARHGEMRTVHLLDGNEVVHYFRMPLASDKASPLYWTSIDVGGMRGKKIAVKAQPPGPDLDLTGLCEQSDSVRRPPDLYREPYRPQFHFSAATGWINDPNGLVHFDGEYHLFYQHNPYGPGSANKSWGHAASRDLVQWTDFGDVLLPDRLGEIYSGSAVADLKNTSGFQAGSIAPLVVFYTSAGAHAPEKLPFTQSMAYSTDRGRTWRKYDRNPVVGHIENTNRDPKVFWHGPSSQWIMVLYLARGKFVLMGSKNLREWQRLSDVEFPDGYECPDLFELSVGGDRGKARWVMWEAGGRYMIGRFDGTRFTPETGVLPSEWGLHCYAGQTWNDAPDGRRIFIGWMRANSAANVAAPVYPDMPFNQQMTFPREFSLRNTADGVRLFARPAREVAGLYGKQHRFSDVMLGTGHDPLAGIVGELFDIEATVEARSAKAVKLEIRGVPLVYDAAEGNLSCLGKSVRVAPAGGRLELRALVDRTSLEIFAEDGRYEMSFCFKPDKDNRKLALTAEGGAAIAKSLVVRELKPALPRVGVP